MARSTLITLVTWMNDPYSEGHKPWVGERVLGAIPSSSMEEAFPGEANAWTRIVDLSFHCAVGELLRKFRAGTGPR